MSNSPPYKQTFVREMPPPGPLGTSVGFVQRVRRQLAPPDSRRERLARMVYAPVLMALPFNPFEPDPLPISLEAELVTLCDIGVERCQRRPIRRITILKLDHIGDLVIGMRALGMLRQGFPDAHITLVCATWNRGLAERLGLFDRVLCFDFFTPLNRDWTATADSLALLYDKMRELQLEPCDLAIDLRHDPDTRPCLARIEAAYRAGFQAPGAADQTPLDLMLPVSEGIAGNDDVTHSIHAELRLMILASAVVAAFAVPPPHPALRLLTQSRVRKGRSVILAIGAGDPIRSWPIERYAEVGHALHARYGFDITVLGGPAERDEARRLADLLRPLPVRLALNLPVAELPELIAGASLCVCNGSGVSHLAAALGVPTVCLLGGTTRMEVWHPAGLNAISLGGKTACQPCGLKQPGDCPWQVCCLTIIQPAHVLAVCEELLETSDDTL